MVLSPTIFTVDSMGSGTSGSGTSGTLPYVISQANANTNTDGSEIEFDPSVFTSSAPQTITLGATLVLSETAGPEVIDGPGAGIVTVSGSDASRVFLVDNGVTASISGLTISGRLDRREWRRPVQRRRHDHADQRHCQRQFRRQQRRRRGKPRDDGGLQLPFSSDTAALVGGGIRNDGGGMVNLTNCTFSHDVGGSEFGGGGGLSNYAIMTVNGCIFSGNSGPYGSGLYNAGPTSLTVNNSTFSDNSASVFGGGIDDEGGPLTVDGCTFSGNSAASGGGLDDAYGGSVTVYGSTFTGNSATTGGYGLSVGAGSTARADRLHHQRKSPPANGGGLATRARRR